MGERVSAGSEAVDAGGSGGPMRSPSDAEEWFGIIGTGQSLSVGTTPVNPAVNERDDGNLMLSLGAARVPPFDPEDPELSVVALREPQRSLHSGYPSPYPGNLYGETPHGAMAAQVSALIRDASEDPHVTVHSIVGESGQGMVALRKGADDSDPSIGRAYAASLFEVEALQRIASSEDRRYQVSAIVMTHGETDAGNPSYEQELVQLRSDYETDIRAVTDQTAKIPMIVSQHHAYGFTLGTRSGSSTSTLAQWRAAVNHPGDFLCSGPKYHYPYIADGIHLTAEGYEMLGEKYGQVYFEAVVMKREWRPLEPVEATREGRSVRVRFHVPEPPLVFDEEIPMPHTQALTEWQAGRGFELRAGSNLLAIESVSIDGEGVLVTSDAELPAGVVVGYAVTNDGTQEPGFGHRFGQLRDSDPFVGTVTRRSQPNYAVAFEMSVP